MPFDGRLTLSVADAEPDLRITLDAAPETPVDMIWFLAPLVLDTPAGVLAVADYSDGHLYPLNEQPFPGRWLTPMGSLDMPWVGVCDVDRGFGYCLILETPEDVVVESKPQEIAGRTLAAPRAGWQGIRGTFGRPRGLLYRFVSEGGHVALAKAYRRHAEGQGLIVPLSLKAEHNPAVARLFGAIDVWGGSLGMARDAHAAGVDRMLWHGDASATDLAAINALGYLTSKYDNYTDVEPLKPDAPVDSTHDRVPENVVLEPDGQRMKAWLTYDGKTQFMKRCPRLWQPSAQAVVPAELATKPYLGRFIDVTTAEALYECQDPAHPLDRAQKLACGIDLLGYVRGLNLVVGGEHGRWWAVPQLDYVEGMLSHNPSFAWPAGHLIRPKAKDETYTGPYKPSGTWEDYARDGIGHERRVPLWELVFHDCVVSTWYWGDSSDFLGAVDPTNQDRKDAFNVLYATMPMIWADRPGGWRTNRDRFLATFQRVSPVVRVLAAQEMCAHEFISADRSLQRTRWSDGSEVVVNFGKEVAAVSLGGKEYRLGPYGYAARGPRLDAAYHLDAAGTPQLTVNEVPAGSALEASGH
jgi:hypothetical protein